MSLLGIEKARIDSVYIGQKHEDGKVRLELTVETETAGAAAAHSAAKAAAGAVLDGAV